MASTPTTRNRLSKQGTGDNSGTWGGVLNTQAIDMVDEALDGLSSVAITGNVTLSSVNYTTDQSRKRILKLTGTPSASYIITIPSVEKFYLVHNATNAAQTIKAGGTGVSIPVASLVPVYCDGTDCFSPTQTVAAAIGAVTDFAGTTAPSGWLLCYGQAISRATYAALFGVIDVFYGAGDGSSTFNLPDCRGRTSAGLDNMGGVAAARLTGYTTLGVTGGAQTVTLIEANLPPHDHEVFTHNHSYTRYNELIDVGAGSGITNLWRNTSTQNTGTSSPSTDDGNGTSSPVANVQPTIAFNKIIYAGV